MRDMLHSELSVQSELLEIDSTIFEDFESPIYMHNLQYWYCWFTFRGIESEIDKFVAYIENAKVINQGKNHIRDDIFEIKVCAGEKTPELVREFAVLKCVGFFENWQDYSVGVVYSESGYSVITDFHDVGYFDPEIMDSGERWEWQYYATSERIDIQLENYADSMHPEKIFYLFPFSEEWERDDYVFEKDRKWYAKQSQQQFIIEDGTLYDCLVKYGEVVIPDGVEIIAYDAFSGNIGITSVVIPESVKKIGDWSFYSCKSLHSVKICGNVTEIGEGAFANCPKLQEINIPDSVAVLGQGVFSDTLNLPDIIFNSDQTALFYYSPNRKDTVYDIPETVVKIASSAFYGCENLQEINVPDSVQEIGTYAFYGCSCLAKMNLPPQISAISDGMFQGCVNLTQINIPESVTVIERHAFTWCKSLKNIDFPETLMEIGESAFHACQNIRLFDLPDSVEHIGRGAFSYCTAMTEFLFPEQIREIPREIFATTYLIGAENKKLKRVFMSDNVTKIGTSAFANCISLMEIELSENIEIIEDAAFKKCTALAEIQIPKNTKELGQETFFGCSRLYSLTIPGTVKVIPRKLCMECTTLINVEIEDGVEKIDTWAFSKCYNLQTIIIPPSVKKFGKRVFNKCEEVTIYGKQESAAESYARENGIGFAEGL